MGRRNRQRGLVIGALAALAAGLCAAQARAQSLHIDLGADEAVVGEPVALTASVSGVDSPVVPQPPDTKDFTFRLVNPNAGSRTKIVNGRLIEQAYDYQFEARPTKKGHLTIPPFTIAVNGQSIKSNRQSLTVGGTAAGPNLIAEVLCAKDVIYVGQPVEVTLQIWVRKFRQGNFILSADNMWVIWRQLAASESALGVFAQADFNRPGVREAQRNDDDGVPRDFYVYRLDLTVTPTKAGPFEFGSIEIAYRYPLQLERNMFDQVSISRALRLKETPKLPDLTVKAIPDVERPADYNGAVGRYSIATSARPTAVPVGDPITLSLTVRGAGSLEALSAPRLDRVPALTKDFEVPSESLAGTVSGVEKVFTQTIRPKRLDVKRIPEIPLSYFDPETGKFATAVSREIPIQVRPAERATPLPLPPDASARASTISELSDGLEANEDDPNLLLADQRPMLGPVSWTLLGAMPLAYLAVSLMHMRTQRYRNNVALRRRSQAMRLARRTLRQASTPGGAASAVLGYVADCCNVPAGGLTRGEAVRLLSDRKLPEPALRTFDEVLSNLEQASYGGAPAGGNNYADDAHRVIADLEAAGLR